MKPNVLPVTIKHKGYQGDVSHRQKKWEKQRLMTLKRDFQYWVNNNFHAIIRAKMKIYIFIYDHSVIYNIEYRIDIFISNIWVPGKY